MISLIGACSSFSMVGASTLAAAAPRRAGGGWASSWRASWAAGHAIKPLMKLWDFTAGACSLGQDSRPPGLHRKTPALTPPKRRVFILSSNPCGCPERNDLLADLVFGMRARTCQQRPARPEGVI